MKNKRTFQGVAVLLAATVVFFCFYRLHFIDDWPDGVLLWNSHEAYLFAGLSSNGYRATPVGVAFGLVPAFFNLPSMKRETARGSTLVFHITKGKVDRTIVLDRTFSTYVPDDQAIYAWHKAGPLWKWTGGGFQEATPEDLRRIIPDPRSAALSAQKDFSNRDGWSARHNLTGWPAQFEIQLDGEPVRFFTKLMSDGDEIRVDIQLGDASHQTLIHASSRAHLVTKSEYDGRFQGARPISE